MKKLLGIVVLSLLFCNTSNAGGISVNVYLKAMSQNDEKLTATKQAIATEQAIEALNLPTEKRDQEDVQISDFMPCYGSSIEQTKLDELYREYLSKENEAYRNINIYINNAIARFNQIYNLQQNTDVSESAYPDYLDYEYFLKISLFSNFTSLNFKFFAISGC